MLGAKRMFVDETGNYKFYEFEPVALTVKELARSD